MSKSAIESTNAENLEARFDASEGVLDYFDLRTARIVPPAGGAAMPRFSVDAGRVPTVVQLKKAVRIAERLQKLEQELSSILKNLKGSVGSRSLSAKRYIAHKGRKIKKR